MACMQLYSCCELSWPESQAFSSTLQLALSRTLDDSTMFFHLCLQTGSLQAKQVAPGTLFSFFHSRGTKGLFRQASGSSLGF